MKLHSTAKWTALLIGFAAIIRMSVLVSADSDRQGDKSATRQGGPLRKAPIVTYNDRGELIRPNGYRKWIYVGTPLTPHDMNDGKAAFPEFHSVYIDPAAYDHYEQTGKFSDGTVMIKELITVGAKQATSGSGYFMGDFTGLEVLIKDKKRFRDEPGNWGFFSFGHEYPLKPTAKIQPTANCNDCHGGAADDDYVFTQYYPVLRDAKNLAN